jgi:hypothetical protein
MKERDFQSKIIRYFRDRTAFVFNIHGGEFQKAGMPDLLILHRAWKGFLELKVDSKVTILQRFKMKEIKARGFPCYVLFPGWIEDENGNHLADYELEGLLGKLIGL